MKQTRSSFKEENTTPNNEQEQPKKRTPKWVQVRLFPILIRLLLITALAAGSLVIGLMVGYGVIGDGNPSDALKKETWTHIIDIVTKDTE